MGYIFLIVGEGSERPELERSLKSAEFTGFIDGEELSAAYANMDVFLFPSETDAYGNVIQEAAASGVPSIVSDKGGPKYLVEHGVTGYVVSDQKDYSAVTVELMNDPEKRRSMSEAARERAAAQSWDAVFAGVFSAYEETLQLSNKKKKAGTTSNAAAEDEG